MRDRIITGSLSSANLHQAIRPCVVVCLLLILTGCFPADECRNCSSPDQAISELRLHGVAITTETYPFPETIDTYSVTNADYSLDEPVEYLDSNVHALFFSPPLDRAISAHPADNEWDEHPYAYRFSEFIDGDYRPIKPLLPYNYSAAPTTDLSSEFAPIKVRGEPSELVLYGNHVLQGNAAFPKNATHVELWNRQQREDQLTLVRRVALDKFYAWRQYFKPVFDADS